MLFVTATTMTAGVQLIGRSGRSLYSQGRGVQATLKWR